MRINQFKELIGFDQAKLVQKRLDEMKEQKLSDKQFKCDALEFTLDAALKALEEKGYMRYDGKIIERLTAEDMVRLKRLATDSYGSYYKAQSLGANITVDRGEDPIQATTVRVYKSVWEKWGDFCKSKSAISKEELLTTALEDFMKKYGGIID